MRPLEVTTKGVIATVLVFTIAAVCVRLGFWQLDRRAQRLERNEAVAERLEAAPVPLFRAPRDTAGLTHRRVILSGQWDGPRSVVLAGRSRFGAPGVHVLTPLRVGGGALLVNRGWLPAADAATVPPERTGIAGEAEVEGILLPFPDIARQPEPEGFRRTWFRFDGENMRTQFPYDVAPLYLLRTAGPDAAAGSQRAPLPLEPPALDAGPHLSYALQWFGFAVVAIVGWAALVLGRHKRQTPRPGAAAG